jgi:hypothetical protein
MHISISFTKKEFDELLTLAAIGEYIRDGVLDDRDEYNITEESTLMEKLYLEAKKHKIPGIETKDLGGFKYTGPTNEREEAEHAWIEEHDEENFWTTLTTHLSRRDFFRDMTKEDEKQMSETGWLPEKLEIYTKKYETEFETYGAERLRIDENTPVPSTLLDEEKN